MDKHWQGLADQYGQPAADATASNAAIIQPHLVAIQEQFDLLEAVLQSSSLSEQQADALRENEWKRLAREDCGTDIGPVGANTLTEKEQNRVSFRGLLGMI